MGQLVDLMDNFFKKQKLNAKALHLSLFNLNEIKRVLKSTKGKKIVLLFKVLDSLEMLKRDYSKEFLSEIVPLVDKVAVSFATRSMIKRKKFNVERAWILNFIKDNFKILDDFEIAGERYVIFENGRENNS